jgi:hypothetical protein
VVAILHVESEQTRVAVPLHLCQVHPSMCGKPNRRTEMSPDPQVLSSDDSMRYLIDLIHLLLCCRK